MIGGNVSFLSLITELHLDAVYTIQADTTYNFSVLANFSDVSFLVHGVFAGSKSGDFSSAVVSAGVSRSPCMPVVNHMVFLNETYNAAPSLRLELGIEKSARVFCRHGGPDTFSIAEAREAVCKHARDFPQDAFLLLGTAVVACETGIANILHLPANTDLLYKSRFLNSCDACVHARADGETFGLAIAECSMAGLPVITFAYPPPGADAHLLLQGRLAVKYSSGRELTEILAAFNASVHHEKALVYRSIYKPYSPDAVMLEFLVNFGIFDGVKRGGRALPKLL